MNLSKFTLLWFTYFIIYVNCIGYTKSLKELIPLCVNKKKVFCKEHCKNSYNSRVVPHPPDCKKICDGFQTSYLEQCKIECEKTKTTTKGLRRMPEEYKHI